MNELIGSLRRDKMDEFKTKECAAAVGADEKAGCCAAARSGPIEVSAADSDGGSVQFVVRRDKKETVGANSVAEMGGNLQESIGALHSETVGGNRASTVGADQSTTIGRDLALKAGRNANQSVGNDLSITAGKEFVINAGDQLTLKTGQASIILKKKRRHHHQRHPYSSESIRRARIKRSEDPAELSGRQAALVSLMIEPSRVPE